MRFLSFLVAFLFTSGMVFGQMQPHYGQNMFYYGRATSDQLVPALTNNAQGICIYEQNEDLTTGTLRVMMTGLSGNITGIDLMEGAVGTNGTLIQTIPVTAGNRTKASITITTANLTAMHTNNAYILIKTAANPTGEVRCNLTPDMDATFFTELTPDKVVPAVTGEDSRGLVVASMLKGSNSIEVYGVFNSLSSSGVLCHFHKGVAGANGPVVMDLGPLLKSDNTLNGVIDNVSGSFINQLFNDSIYVQTHTANHGAGEIRGQMKYFPFAFDAFLSKQDDASFAGHGVSFIWPNATMDTLYYRVLANDNTTGPSTGIHLHSGTKGTKGPHIFDLVMTDDYSAYGSVAVSATTQGAGIFGSLINGKTYMNFHTAANQTLGEMREQMWSGARAGYFCDAAGDQAVPTVTGTAYGLGYLSMNRRGYDARIAAVWDSLSGPVSISYLGKGSNGMAGNIVFMTDPFRVGNTIDGWWYNTSSTPLTQALADEIENGRMFLNLTTAAHTTGEIRGHFSYTGAPVSRNNTLETKIGIVAYPNPTTDVLNINIEDANQSYTVSLTDFTGKVCAQQTVQSTGAIATSNLASGIYCIKVVNANNQTVFTHKVVKN